MDAGLEWKARNAANDFWTSEAKLTVCGGGASSGLRPPSPKWRREMDAIVIMESRNRCGWEQKDDSPRFYL